MKRENHEYGTPSFLGKNVEIKIENKLDKNEDL